MDDELVIRFGLSEAVVRQTSTLGFAWKALLPGDVKLLNQLLSIAGELVELDLRHNKLGDEGAVTLITGLRRSSSTTLKIVRLSRNRITDRGGAAIAEYLADNQVCMSLRQLDLSVNALRDDTSIGGAIKANRRLSELDLSSNALRTGHVIASALGTNRSLTHANLLYNRLDIGSAVELAAVVRASRAHGVSLTLCGVPPDAECINLPRRNMSTSDAILLAAELETSHTVRSVDLSHNALGPRAASALADALGTRPFCCPTLEYFDPRYRLRLKSRTIDF